MLIGIILALLVSFISVLCSPMFKKFTKGSGFLKRLLSHILFLLFYIAVYLLAIHKVDFSLHGNSFTPNVIGLANGCLFYLLLLTAYEGILGKIDRSVSLKILVEIDETPDRRVSLYGIGTLFSVETMISERLEGLLQHHFAVQEDSYFKTTLKGNICARLLIFVRRIFSTEG